MSGLVTNEGELIALRYITGAVASTEGLVLKLFQNNLTPTEGTLTGALTEATFTGYAAAPLTSWTFTAGEEPVAEHPLVDFTSTIDQTAQIVYGYYIVQAGSGSLVFVERFPLPVQISFVGDTVRVQPRLVGRGE